MALIDFTAADCLRELREEHGLSPEALADELRERAKREPWGARGAVDAHTIRRIENRGHVPGPRIQFVLARFFDLSTRDIWAPGHQRAAA